MSKQRFPEIHDLVAVSMAYVDYYGYVENIDPDMRHPRLKVEFRPGDSEWFDFADCRLVNIPEDEI